MTGRSVRILFRIVPCFLFACAASAARPGSTQPAPSQPLPLRDVVLFSSGVGYFQRSGRIEGAAAVDLSFRAEQVNDILKSLVLFDPAGQVQPVTYSTKDPLSRQLRGSSIALGDSVSTGALLRQFQGATVRLQTGVDPVEGRVLSVSVKAVPTREGGVVQTEVLNLLTPEGLRSIALDQVTHVKLLDERLDRQLRNNLELLATGLDDQRRAIELRFGGGGAREVEAGYLLEMPVWKTSYRLVLEKEKPPYLQGWAIVENTTDEDWQQVRLSLVSGRPISFLQDLYQPLYLPRPTVEPQIVGSPLPQTYGAAIEEEERIARVPRITGAVNLGLKAGEPAGPRGPAGPAGPSGIPARSEAQAGKDLVEARVRRQRAALAAEQLASSVASQAEGSERGALFEYALREPVSIPKQQAAMVPIVTARIEGEPLSLFDPGSDASHALAGFRLKNSTGLHLSGGPITLFRDGVYAGDAQIAHLPPGEDRLLSYAVDLDLVTARETPSFHQETVSVSARSGVLAVTRQQRKTYVYTFRNQSDQPKTVLIQQPLEPGFSLARPQKPAEQTAREYRFRLAVPAGQSARFEVVLERPLQETLALLPASPDLLASYAQNAKVAEPLRAALKQLLLKRRRLADLQGQREQHESELKSIDEEQSRIRRNMAQLDRNSPLYQQYVQKLTAQETRIERLRGEIARLGAEEAAVQKEIREFVDSLGEPSPSKKGQ